MKSGTGISLKESQPFLNNKLTLKMKPIDEKHEGIESE